ncbi:hypothetical protein LSAT2_023918 [Lamellibrachia satsuma]|nr:hypothetical protein LSAT2_023918 [Lamellibrachia satsuma]
MPEVDESELFRNEMKLKVNCVFNKVSNLLRFPNSPKLTVLPMPDHLSSRKEKIEKLKEALNRYKSTKLRRAIIANADADLLCALAECAYNILKNNIPLSDLQRQRLSKYRTKLRELSQRRTPAARRRRILLQRQVGEGQSGGFLSAFLAPLASSVFLPLLQEVLFKK